MGENLMQEACIIIIYHTGVEELTQRHYDRFKQFNPEIPIVIIKHEDFELLPYWNYDDMWHSNDSILYRWFLSDKKILAERYFIFDYDTYCNDSIKNYYKNVWNEQAACSDHFSIQQYHNWSWFEKHQQHLSIYKDRLYGISPPVSLMVKHDVLNNLIQEQINNSIWKNVFLEVRMGSILNINGVKIASIDKTKKHYISPFTHVVPENYKEITGIFHPVKNIEKEKVINKNNITYVSAAYFSNETFDSRVIGLVTSNKRYNKSTINFYGKGETYTGLYDIKVPKLLNFLENKCDTEIVCFVDSADTFLNRELDSTFIDTFKSFNCSVVFNAETSCYPLDQLNFIDKSSSEFKYLNSGLFVGYKDFIIKMIKDCMIYYDNFPLTKNVGWGAPNDQLYYWLVFLKYQLLLNNEIKLDHKNDLFLCMQGKELMDFDYSSGYVLYKNKRPYIIHCPGSNKITNYKDMMTLSGYIL